MLMMLGRSGGLGKNASPADARDAGPVWGPWQNPSGWGAWQEPSPADADDAGPVWGPWQKPCPADAHDAGPVGKNPAQLMLMMLGRLGLGKNPSPADGGLGKNPCPADAHDAGPVGGPWHRTPSS